MASPTAATQKSGTGRCALLGCNKEGCGLRCADCRGAFYCSEEHQRSAWKSHKPICLQWKSSRTGYPEQALQKIYGMNRSDLKPASMEEMMRLNHGLEVLFWEQRPEDMKASRQSSTAVCVVEREKFAEQFQGITSGVFDGWGPELWDHVMVAGGSVLCSVLPKSPGFSRLGRGLSDPDLVEFNFSSTCANGRRLPEDKDDKSFAEYLQDVCWPNGDIDLFLHSLKDDNEASAKMRQVLVAIRKKIKLSHGVEKDVLFCRTANTVTIISPPLRKIQVITRLYANKHDILNSFDIDCCCVGWDGSEVLATQRCIDALRTHVNIINLEVRGDAYENRLLKYATRGFGIGVPGLKQVLSLVDGNWTRPEVSACGYNGETTLDGDGWQRWADSDNLARLLMARHLAKKLIVIYTPFAGRQRQATGRDLEASEHVKHRFIAAPGALGAVSDSYPSHDKTNRPICPATSQLSALGLGASEVASGKFGIAWRFGNMPRKPLSFEAWSSDAMEGSKKRDSSRDWKATWEERKVEQASAKKAADEQQAKERAEERAAEFQALQKEANEQAQVYMDEKTRKLEKKMAKEKSVFEAQKSAVEAQRSVVDREKMGAEKALREAQKQRDEATRKLQMAEDIDMAARAKEGRAKQEVQAAEAKVEAAFAWAKLQAQRAQAQAKQAQAASNASNESQLCVICMTSVKTIVLEPCMHLCLCEDCFLRVKQGPHECPMCRAAFIKGHKVYG